MTRWTAEDLANFEKRGGKWPKTGLKRSPDSPAAAPERLQSDFAASVDVPVPPETAQPLLKRFDRPPTPRYAAKMASELRRAERENAQRIFINRCVAYGLPAPTPEVLFHPVRKFRFDFAWPAHKVAVEVQGGLWSKGRGKAAHGLPLGILRDYCKANLAQEAGWTVLFYTPQQLKNALPQIKRVLVGPAGNPSASAG